MLTLITPATPVPKMGAESTSQCSLAMASGAVDDELQTLQQNEPHQPVINQVVPVCPPLAQGAVAPKIEGIAQVGLASMH
jgi:hypothetical protein